MFKNGFCLLISLLLATTYADAYEAESSNSADFKRSDSSSSGENCNGLDSNCPSNEICAGTDNCVVLANCFHRCFPCTCVHGVCLIDTRTSTTKLSCICDPGWTGTNCGADINECSDSPCTGPTAVCSNNAGSFSCSCGDGHALISPTECADINECLDSPCTGPTAVCSNNAGSFSCSCGDGHSLICPTECADINECLDSPCTGPTAVCSNNAGSFSCSCGDGHALICPTECADIDECIQDVCNQTCTNTDGSYRCTCTDGYQLAAEGDCLDIDECSMIPDICGPGVACKNDIGNYFCERNCFGYTSSCNCSQTNIDECTLDIDNCEGNCTDTDGSYVCSCGTGFSLSTNGRSCIENTMS